MYWYYYNLDNLLKPFIVDLIRSLTLENRSFRRGIFSKLIALMKPFIIITLFIQFALNAQSYVFDDVAQDQGLDFIHDHGGSGEKYYVETMGSGVCLLDFDNDNDLDIYFCQGAALPGWDKNTVLANKLFRNDWSGC